jgi:hypothetical protein
MGVLADSYLVKFPLVELFEVVAIRFPSFWVRVTQSLAGGVRSKFPVRLAGSEGCA